MLLKVILKIKTYRPLNPIVSGARIQKYVMQRITMTFFVAVTWMEFWQNKKWKSPHAGHSILRTRRFNFISTHFRCNFVSAHKNIICHSSIEWLRKIEKLVPSHLPLCDLIPLFVWFKRGKKNTCCDCRLQIEYEWWIDQFEWLNMYVDMRDRKRRSKIHWPITKAQSAAILRNWYENG